MRLFKRRVLEFPIVPFEGAGPIRFGMAPTAVREALASPVEEFDKYGWQHPSDAFDELGIHVHYSPTGHCATVEFGMRDRANPTYQGRELLDELAEEVVRWASEVDGDLKIDDDGFDSPALGIGIYAPGLLSGPPDEVRVSGVTVFAPGVLETK